MKRIVAEDLTLAELVPQENNLIHAFESVWAYQKSPKTEEEDNLFHIALISLFDHLQDDTATAATFGLGCLFEEQGKKKDLEESWHRAADQYERCAASDSPFAPLAALKLSDCYRSGKGREQNLVKAFETLYAADRKGPPHAEVKFHLMAYHYTGTGTTASPDAAEIYGYAALELAQKDAARLKKSPETLLDMLNPTPPETLVKYTTDWLAIIGRTSRPKAEMN